MLGEDQMPQVDELDVVSLWQPPVNRPVTIEESKPHEIDLGVPLNAGVGVLKESLLAKPFNVNSRAAYDDKVSAALQMATTQIVLSAHQHLPTLSRIRSIRESIEHYKTKIDSSEFPKRMTQELNDFYEWTLEEQYTNPKTLEKYLKDARRLFENADYYYQSEKIVSKLKSFLSHYNEMTKQYLPPESKALPEVAITSINDFIRWSETGDVTQITFNLQRTALINSLYQQCRWHRLGGPYYVEEIYDSVYAVPTQLESHLTVEINQALELANAQQTRQDCLLDLVCKVFPNFMTLILKGSEQLESTSRSIESLKKTDASSPEVDASVSISPMAPVPPPPPMAPPPPPEMSSLNGLESSPKKIQFMRRKLRVDSEIQPSLPSPFSDFVEEEKASGSPLKRAVSRATSIQDAIGRLHQFLQEETEEAKTERLSRLEGSKKQVVEKTHQIQLALRNLRKAPQQPKVMPPALEPELTEAERLKQNTTEQIQAFLFSQRKKEGNFESDSDGDQAWSDEEVQDDNPVKDLGFEDDADELADGINRLKLTL